MRQGQVYLCARRKRIDEHKRKLSQTRPSLALFIPDDGEDDDVACDLSASMTLPEFYEAYVLPVCRVAAGRSRKTVLLTERSAMCAECYAGAMRACQQERMEGGLDLYCPGPEELRRRIEAVRDSIGDSPRPDHRPIGQALVGTMLYVPQPSRVAAARRALERMGAA